MSDTKPVIPAELPDDYKELQALAAAHDLPAVGVKKRDLVVALEARRVELGAGDDGDPDDDDAFVPCDDCSTPESCATDGCAVDNEDSDTDALDEFVDGLDVEDELAGRAPITRTRPDGTWWCPFCDHSNGTDRGDAAETCRGCGAVRDGDEALAC